MQKDKNNHTLKWAQKFANLLDSRFRFPGTEFRFGLDPVLGLVPGLGDGVTLVFQTLIAISLTRAGTSGKLTALLLINVLLDSLIGSIPVIGQIFDFFFKANERNLRLTKEYLQEGKHRGPGTWIWLAAILMMLVTVTAIIWAIVEIIQWLTGLA